MKLFNNPSGAVKIIVAVLALFLLYKGCNATEVEFGPTYTSQFNGGVSLSLIERVAGDKIDLGLSLVGEQKYEAVELENNGVLWAAFVAERPTTWAPVLPSEVHIGAGRWFKTQSPINGCHSTFLLGLKWRFNDHASIGIRHFSSAGICKPNRGQDLLTFGWRF